VRAGWESFSCQQCRLARLVVEGPEASSFAMQHKGDRYNV
jgi:hypothetical protein